MPCWCCIHAAVICVQNIDHIFKLTNYCHLQALTLNIRTSEFDHYVNLICTVNTGEGGGGVRRGSEKSTVNRDFCYKTYN